MKKRMQTSSNWNLNNQKKKREQARIFLASPSDVNAYRDATKSVIDGLNNPYISREGKIPFYLYMWE